MRTRKIYNNRGGGFFDFFKSKNPNVPPSEPASLPVPVNPNSIPVKKESLLGKVVVKATDKIASPLLDKVDTLKKIDNADKIIGNIDSTVNPIVSKVNDVTKVVGLNIQSGQDEISNFSKKLDDLSSKLDPIKSVIHNVSEIIKTNPIGYLIVGTLLFVKKLKDLYRNHQQIVGFLTQVETILENSYRLNELIDKINEMMVIYTFNNQEYKNKYEELFNLEKEILNTNNDNSLKELNIKKKELFNGLLETANNNKQQYRAQVSDVQFDDLSKYIEPNKLIKQQLTEKIAEINKYLLGIATNDMLKTLSADMNIIKSGLIRLVNDEIELRNKKRFKWVRDRKRDWDRVNSRDSIMRKLNDDLIMMNSLFILVKFQMDFTLEYYKNKNLSPEEWNTLWKLITSFKEYTSYMIPSEVFMTIKYVNDLMEFNEAESKKAIMELGELIEMENLNEFGEATQEESNEDNESIEGPGIEETPIGGKNKTRKNKTRKNKPRKNKTRKNKTRKNKTRKNKTRKNKIRKNKTLLIIQ